MTPQATPRRLRLAGAAHQGREPGGSPQTPSVYDQPPPERLCRTLPPQPGGRHRPPGDRCCRSSPGRAPGHFELEILKAGRPLSVDRADAATAPPTARPRQPPRPRQDPPHRPLGAVVTPRAGPQPGKLDERLRQTSPGRPRRPPRPLFVSLAGRPVRSRHPACASAMRWRWW